MNQQQIRRVVDELLADLPPASLTSEDVRSLTLARDVVPMTVLQAASDLLRASGIVVDRFGDGGVIADVKRLRHLLGQLAAVELFDGDLAAARAWLERPAPALGGVAPITMLTAEPGFTATIDLIGRLKHGVFI
ncbi:antitoxin Xre/MbcA/ParS toxin-binding domain-containing protein [Stutzerimonas stutzeri]|jgi:hypothetical protein|uniref:Putative toxin-antitoxin system antitoxin component (TIGR02293 family) n=1 Tax=Stutzerimonas stutzeri TaxID=316 RepID=A0A5S5BE73_STUST|nr:antitoxin Xre/MbcA/ParS toxin-binding domain-containing protein [Stutzerimonas stutzeri]TYP65355.1 putative toxin-antitoxin system antitoxin component (TIGR02293 family) [Stutzerimonas stutzeri]